MPPTHICPNASGTLRALYCIFVQPTLSSSSRRLPRHPPSRATPSPHIPTLRTFSTTSTLSAAPRIAEKRTQKWDAEITARMVQLVDPSTNKLSEPQTRFDVFGSYDPKTHRLVQLSPDEPGNRTFTPVCKIIDKKDAYNADRKKKEQQKESKAMRAKENSVKTLELNWAIDGNDLNHRMERVREFLEEGRRVEIVVAAKKRGRKASGEECRGLMERIRGVVGEVGGAKEVKGFEGKMGGFGMVVLQGKGVVGKKDGGDGEEATSAA